MIMFMRKIIVNGNFMYADCVGLVDCRVHC